MFPYTDFVSGRGANLYSNKGGNVLIDGTLHNNDMTHIVKVEYSKKKGPYNINNVVFVACKSDKKDDLQPVISMVTKGSDNNKITKMGVTTNGNNFTSNDNGGQGKWNRCTYFGKNDFAICVDGDEFRDFCEKTTNDWMNSSNDGSNCGKC